MAHASKIYHDVYGKWPTGLLPLARSGSLEVDGWKRPLIYQPFDAAKGYGAVISFGRDGRPGGTGEDADLVVRFGAKP